MTADPTPPTFPSEPGDGQEERPPIRLERRGVRTFDAHAPRGQVITVGPADVAGAITPGELLQIALAACNAMSADARLAHALGDEHDATWWVRAIFDGAADSYTAFDVVADPAGDVSSIASRAHAAVERTCTVGHTLKTPPVVTLTVGGQTFEE